MSRSKISTGIRRLASLVALATLATLPVVAAPPSAGAATGQIYLEGHGWGHGRGLGQYGSLGYAVDQGKDWTWILDHFYGGTHDAAIGNVAIRVRLVGHDDVDTIVYAPGKMTTSATGANQYSAVLVRKSGSTYRVYAGANCAGNNGTWPYVGAANGPVHIVPANQAGGADNLLRTCELDGSMRWYRGTIWATQDSAGPQRTMNEVAMEDYLRGVVPRESPAYWGDKGSGAGMNALRAQAVAARSYAAAHVAAAGGSPRYSYADICDTTACQVYGGYYSSSLGQLEWPNTDNAVAQTAGHVRRFNSNNGIARTEFSSSTGGWTAGGTFPAVVDEGDATSSNPNHTWNTSVPVSSIEGNFPQIGRLYDVQITGRNGLGDWGGRVTKVKLVGTSGSVAISGNDFRSRFHLKSDWFRVTQGPPPLHAAGYWAMSTKGGFYTFGNGGGVPFYGSAANIPVVGQFVAGMAHPSRGYYGVTDRGAVYAFGAPFYGAATDIYTVGKFVDAAVHPSGQGYYLMTDRGAVYTYGHVPFFGAATNIRTVGKFVSMIVDPQGRGYYLITDRGAVYTFGKDLPFYGAATDIPKAPIVDAIPDPGGNGYGLISEVGGVYAFGKFAFRGSVAGIPISGQVVRAANYPKGGYYMVTDRGGVYALGAPFFGSATNIPNPGMVDILSYPQSQ